MSTNWKHDVPKPEADPNWVPQVFIKSEREQTIDALCEAVRRADNFEARRKAEWNLVNYIENNDA